MTHSDSEGRNRKRETNPQAVSKRFAQEVVDKVIDEYCRIAGVHKPVMIYSESAFATHKAKMHHENRSEVLKDIRESNNGRNRALTCDRCFGVILMRPKNLGILQDPMHIVEPIKSLKDNIRFQLLHELMHVKLRDSEFKKLGTYHGRNLLLQFNLCAGRLGVTKYKE